MSERLKRVDIAKFEQIEIYSPTEVIENAE